MGKVDVFDKRGCSSNFSTSVNVWIDRCTLHINFTQSTGNETCLPRKYRVIIKTENNTITQTDTDILKYSYWGINSTFRYMVEVIPVFSCGVRTVRTVWGNPRGKNISTSINFPEQNITANESTNVTILCPIQGAYEFIDVIKWRHTIHDNNVVIRSFTTPTVRLVDVKFEDSGTYFYTAQYRGCGSQPSKLTRKEGFVRLVYHGSPIILTVKTSPGGYPRERLTYLINVISFPKPPNRWITIKNMHGSMLNISCSKLVPAVLPYPLHGKVLNVSGYEMTLDIVNVTNKWVNEITVFVENDFGRKGFKVTPEEMNPDLSTFEGFINMNMAAVYGLCGGVLFVFITSGIAICCFRKKRKAACELQRNETSREYDASSLQVVERIYTPDEAVYQDGDFINNQYNQNHIERERQQIASLYSYGGFSLGEFHEEDTTYNNDVGRYGNIQ